jgi:Family of unknown function (DUF5906)
MELDFCRVKVMPEKNEKIEILPDFRVMRSKDLMIQGKTFYAIWDQARNMWSDDEYDVPRLVDELLDKTKEEVEKRFNGQVYVRYMNDYGSSSWRQFRNYIGHLSDSAHQLDENLTFSNSDVKKTDYVSRRLPYPLAPGDISSWDEIIGTLYKPEERAKIEWAIGAIVSGDSKKIQKFLVFYGAPGAGKGTILEIIMKLFEGYYTTFEAKALTGNNTFATEAFKSNPLVAIDPDGDMSKIEDNTKLNSIVGHDAMTINEKYKPQHTMRIRSFLIMATNKPVKITDAMSGLIRRMIDVHPSGEKLSPRRYQALMSQIDFELGAIAHHCLDVYRSMGKDAYSGYVPVQMMLQTNVFFNFIEAYYDVFKEQDGVTLSQAYEMYKTFCNESGFEFQMNRMKLRDELSNYFDNFEDRAMVGDTRVRSWYSGFNAERYKAPTKKDEKVFSLVMDETESIVDLMYSDQPAQYTTQNETPLKKWADVTSKLSEIDTTKLHYVKPPANHIVIDFDLKDANGAKSAERNLEAASNWPSTYAEYSKSGAGVHLHYIYDGDVSELSRVYDDGIEVKVFTGDSSLRRRLLKCNNIPIATISSGLPLKEKKPVINTDVVKSEKTIRNLIEGNLKKEYHNATKPSIDFIKKILDDAYASGLTYDVSDLKPKIGVFASLSTNQVLNCLRVVKEMKFKSADMPENQTEVTPSAYIQPDVPDDDEIYYFDVEVYPNLFIVCYKRKGSKVVVRMINPKSHQIEKLLKLKLVGFYNRNYDNHIIYAAYLGYDNAALYDLSQRLISGDSSAKFGEAYNISYADIYDYSSKKQSLKKFQIELGLHHQESNIPWDKPVPEEQWPDVEDYCVNDVITTEQVAEDREQDFVARQILASLSGLSVNDTTARHTAKIVFGDDRRPQDKFKYTKLDTIFHGYKYDFGTSTYRGENPSEGGYVYEEPGMYEDVVVLDITSMHPTSIKNLELFGPDYTPKFWELVEARVAIKNEDYDKARTLLGGKLAPYLKSPDDAEALSYALKIVINIVYGLTSAKFPNVFKDPNNIDNIVAKRGALFMIDLKHFVQSKGYQVVHIKTDSIKIPGVKNKDAQIIKDVMEFGAKYGYNFECEAIYSKFCLVNKAVYIAKYGWAAKAKKIGTWEAVGAQFQHPYVFKTLFSKEPLTFRDKCEEKHVQTSLWLDFESVTTMGMINPDAAGQMMKFVGKGGLFCPIKPGRGGALLMREKDGKFAAATGTKGFEWMEAEMVKTLGKEDDIDLSYFNGLVDSAVDTISKFGDFESLVDDGHTMPGISKEMVTPKGETLTYA